MGVIFIFRTMDRNARPFIQDGIIPSLTVLQGYQAGGWKITGCEKESSVIKARSGRGNGDD